MQSTFEIVAIAAVPKFRFHFFYTEQALHFSRGYNTSKNCKLDHILHHCRYTCLYLLISCFLWYIKCPVHGITVTLSANFLLTLIASKTIFTTLDVLNCRRHTDTWSSIVQSYVNICNPIIRVLRPRDLSGPILEVTTFQLS